MAKQGEGDEEAGSKEARLQTGVPGFDKLVDGGYVRGRIVLVLGEPGTGKTILCSQFLHWGATKRGERVVFIGMNEPKKRFMEEMHSLGMTLANWKKRELSTMSTPQMSSTSPSRLRWAESQSGEGSLVS